MATTYKFDVDVAAGELTSSAMHVVSVPMTGKMTLTGSEVTPVEYEIKKRIVEPGCEGTYTLVDPEFKCPVVLTGGTYEVSVVSPQTTTIVDGAHVVSLVGELS